MRESKLKFSDVLVARKRLAGLIVETPLRKSDWLSISTGAEVFLKLENVQKTGSFKYRGALNALSWAKENGIRTIFTASAGNHGIGVAEASTTTEQEVTVCVPVTAAQIKLKRLQGYNVSLIQHGDDCEVTEAFAERLAKEQDGFYVSPYNNCEVIAGQGTIALEMLEQIPNLSVLIVSTGGGGLISGVGLVAKSINPDIRVIGVAAAKSAALATSARSGRIIRIDQEKTIADGLAGNIEPGSMTFPLVQKVVDDWVIVQEQDIVSSIFEFLENEGMLIEGAAAAAVAAVSRGHIQFTPKEHVGVVVCGGNISRQDWCDILRQRLSGEKASVG